MKAANSDEGSSVLLFEQCFKVRIRYFMVIINAAINNYIYQLDALDPTGDNYLRRLKCAVMFATGTVKKLADQRSAGSAAEIHRV